MMDDKPLIDEALEALISVLCNPEGEVCIEGSDGDRDIVQKALKALGQPDQWQPIETAPPYKDILLCTDCQTIVTGRKIASGYELIGTSWPLGTKHMPTHWMPLPKPPEDET